MTDKPLLQKRKIPIARPWLGEEECQAVRRPLLSGWVTQGPEVEAFEREFASFVGAGHACAVSNCTVALQLALKVAGVGPGDEVVTVSHSFIATANAVRHCGAQPVFVDIDLETFNMDPRRVEEAVTDKTRAILCVHQMGMPCDLTALSWLAERLSLPLIEDAACAVGSEVFWRGQWEKIGKPHSDIACFSFHPRKIITTGDGGMLTTRHAAWDARFRLLRHQGMSVSDRSRHDTDTVVFETFDEVGFNFRLTDIQAAVGREQLKRLPEILRRRRELAARYLVLLAEIPWLVLPVEPDYARTNWQSFCVRLPDGVDQKTVIQLLLDAGIASQRGILCAHLEGAYASSPPRHSLHQSRAARDRCIFLPLFHDLEESDQVRVAEALAAALVSSTS